MLGAKLKDLGYVGVAPKRKRWYVKTPTFSFTKITGLDVVLSPEMKSTGEAIGYDYLNDDNGMKLKKISFFKRYDYTLLPEDLIQVKDGE